MPRKEFLLRLQDNYLIYLGLLFIIVFGFWRYHQVRILSFNQRQVEESSLNSSGVRPTYIKSYPVGIDVKVNDTTINNGVWAIHPETASYLVTSAKIGDNGNIIVYGHNKNKIMGPLRWIKEGAIIEVTGSDGQVYKYSVTKIDEVNPDNLQYINPTTEETLTIYTCSGFLDSKRFITVAKPIVN